MSPAQIRELVHYAGRLVSQAWAASRGADGDVVALFGRASFYAGALNGAYWSARGTPQEPRVLSAQRHVQDLRERLQARLQVRA